jgi:hypothetical protein
MTYVRRLFSDLIAFLLVAQTMTAYAAEPQSIASQTSILTGRVIAKGDSGIDGVRVACVAPKDAVCKPSAVSTDRDGKFMFQEVTPSEKYRLIFEHASYLRSVMMGEPGDPMTVQMEPYIIKGLVVEAGTEIKISAATVSCVKKEGPPQRECDSATDNDGQFSMQPLRDILDPSVTYDLIVTHNRFPARRIRDVRLYDPPRDINIELEAPLSGRRYPVETVSGLLMDVKVVKVYPNELVVKDEDTAVRTFPGGRAGRSLPYTEIRTIGIARKRFALVAIVVVAVVVGLLTAGIASRK